MYGIPNMKLPKDVVERRCELMRASGITFELGVDATDATVTKRLLGEEFAAVVVATGARAARMLSCPGADASGVVLAVDYLTASTLSVLDGSTPTVNATDRDVVVIGGGDTGTDCVATVLRQGARSVTQLEFLPAPPDQRAKGNAWPEWPQVKKTDYGQFEAIEIQGADPRQWATNTLEVLTDEHGAARGLHVISLDWAGGRPVPQKGTERELPAQLVLIAMGFSGPEASVYEALGCRVSAIRDGMRPQVEEGTHRVINDGGTLYATGDALNGSSLVVSAIADGLACAAEVAAALGL
jgi:glutamate synthase (NADPH/NADH) small chain